MAIIHMSSDVIGRQIHETLKQNKGLIVYHIGTVQYYVKECHDFDYRNH